MSTIAKSVCDHCGKEVVDPYAEAGWIKLTRGGLSVSVRRGRNSPVVDTPQGEDFCSWVCLTNHMVAVAEARVVREAKERLEAEVQVEERVYVDRTSFASHKP